MNQYKEQLNSILGNLPKISYSDYGYILKGDVSGIQDFIFNVKSEGAAKTLKARSLFIYALSKIALELIKTAFGLQKGEYLEIDGGGNFTILIKKEKFDLAEWDKIVKLVQEDLQYEELYLALAYEQVNESNIADKLKEINTQKLAEEKLRKYKNIKNAFTPFEDSNYVKFDQKVLKDFAGILKSKDNEEVKQQVQKQTAGFFKNKIDCFGYEYELNNKAPKNLQNSVLNKLPTWTEDLLENYQHLISEIEQNKSVEELLSSSEPKTGNIIEFEYLTLFAKERTGTGKLGVLKLDVDDLGLVFRDKSIQEIYQISQALNWFFDKKLWQLLQEKKFEFRTKENDEVVTKKASYQHNIYPLFAGGDDCFLIGAWDAIFEFAKLLRDEFDTFQKELREFVKNIEKDISLSASLLLVDNKFPVIRFAEIAEEELKKAKTFEKDAKEKGKFVKGKVAIFGEVISWAEFGTAINIKNHLLTLIQEKGESRAIIERIKRSAIGFDSLQSRALRGRLAFEKIAKFHYYMRNVKKDNLAYVETELLQEYQRLLLLTISKNSLANAQIFPIAARWTEFLTRKNISNT